MEEEFNDLIYREVLKNKGITSYFQPIVSIKRQKMIGTEALARVFCRGEQRNTEKLFEYARENNKAEELDRWCILNAITEYSKGSKEHLLFCNVESSLLHTYIQLLPRMLSKLEQVGIEPQKIVIEINEKKVESNDLLLNFVCEYRHHGFLIAVDDIGEAESNYNRIALIKPDIIKIDYLTMVNIDKDYYKRAIIESIAFLANKIGAVIIAEGVEYEEQIYTCWNMGIDLFQGYYFSKAIPMELLNIQEFTPKYQELIWGYEKQNLLHFEEKTKDLMCKRIVMKKLSESICQFTEDKFEMFLKDFLKEYREIECIYIIDDQGIQVGECFQKNSDQHQLDGIPKTTAKRHFQKHPVWTMPKICASTKKIM